jgi:RNA polymerase subunit RPABC4/transcription elongation factor Spt4
MSDCSSGDSSFVGVCQNCRYVIEEDEIDDSQAGVECPSCGSDDVVFEEA